MFVIYIILLYYDDLFIYFQYFAVFGVCDSEIKCQSEMLLHNHVTDAPLPRPLYPLIKHRRGSTRLMCQTACADCLISYESDSRACVFVSKSAGSFVYGERKRKVNTFNLIEQNSDSLRTWYLYIRWVGQGKSNYLRHIVDECNNYC